MSGKFKMEDKEIIKLLKRIYSKTILILDDDPYQIEILKTAINEIDQNIQIDTTGNPEVAIKNIKERNTKGNLYDVVICDIELNSYLSGFEVIQFCKKKYPNIQTILISSNKKEKYENRYAFKKAQDEFLNKPISLRALYQKLEPILV
tara:strand:+ start:44503 stop:44946 length:444 start_codon:yes stop_codon:yes gene_type:complete